MKLLEGAAALVVLGTVFTGALRNAPVVAVKEFQNPPLAQTEKAPELSKDAQLAIRDLQIQQLQTAQEMSALQARYTSLVSQYQSLDAQVKARTEQALLEVKLDPDKYAVDPKTLRVSKKPTPPAPTAGRGN